MKLYLVGYPRSGNHWVAYILNHLTGLGVSYYEPIPEMIAGPIERIVHTHMHGACDWRDFNAKTDAVVLVSRNYKECIPRHYITKKKPLDFASLIDEMRGTAARGADGYTTDYVALFDFFDRLDSSRSLLVYYEDLISEVAPSVIRRLARFLDSMGQSIGDVERFLRNIDAHRECSLARYEREKNPPSLTRGKSAVYHSRRLLTPEDRVGLDDHLSSNFPVLWERYLNRYAE